MKGTSILIFAIGAAVGAVASYAFAKRKFLALAQEEIASVKETYSKRATAREKPDLSEYAEVIKNEGYSAAQEPREHEKTNKKHKTEKVRPPYVISPDEFAEDDEFDKIDLTLYADGVLTDEDDEVIDDANEIVGKDNLKSFGVFEEDCVFVRNERLKADYEVLLDVRKYSEVAANSPHKIG